MKKQNILLATLLLVIVCITACSERSIEDPFVQIEREITFNFGISQSTRTVTSIDRKTNFIDEDQIGVWGLKREGLDIVHTNLQYEYIANNEKWNAERSITFPLDGSHLNFYAYYPYNLDLKDTKFDFTVAQNQSKEEGFNRSDLLLAMNDKATVDNKSIVLTFLHQLALVETEIALPENESIVKVDIRAKKTATVDLVSQTANVKNDEPVDYITMLKVAEGIFRAVVPMQVINEGKLFRIVTTDGKVNYTYWYKVKENVDLVANKVNSFSINCMPSTDVNNNL